MISSCHDGICKCQGDRLLTPEGTCVEAATTTTLHTTTTVTTNLPPSTTTIETSSSTTSGQLANLSLGWDDTTSPSPIALPRGQRDEGSDRQRKRIPKVIGPPLLPLIPLPSVESGDKQQPTVDETGTRRGVCPPHNPPLMDPSGKLLICNGMEPNCPPKSYCYVTGVASDMYNCCQVH